MRFNEKFQRDWIIWYVNILEIIYRKTILLITPILITAEKQYNDIGPCFSLYQC